MALRDLRVDAEERLAELVDDARAAELGKRVLRGARRDDRAVRQLVCRTVMIGDDHLETARLRLGNLCNSGGAAIDREHEPATLIGEARERLAAHAVPLVEAARQMPVDVGAELA